MTDSTGTVSLSLSSGVYDIALDQESEPGTATCFYGPVTVSGSTTRSFLLHDTEGQPPTRIFGKLLREQGVPAGGERLTLRTGAGRLEEGATSLPAPVEVVTDEDGQYRVDMPTALAIDLEMEDGTFIDFAKREKPCYLEFATDETTVQNRLRCNESDPALFRSEISAQSSGGNVNQKFTGAVYDNQTHTVTLTGGLLPPGGGQAYVRDLLLQVLDFTPADNSENEQSLTQACRDELYLDDGPGMQGCSIRVDTDHAWYWGKYAIHINPPLPASFSFQDQTGDGYGLSVDEAKNKWHRVSYRSSRPAVTEMYYDAVR
jgi:hypothetical protein